MDDRGIPRLVSRSASLDELVRLGFEQVGLAARDHPVVTARLATLVDAVAEAAEANEMSTRETARQTSRLRDMNAG